MTVLLLVPIALLILGALGILLWSVMALATQMGNCRRAGVESFARIKGVGAGIREEGDLLRCRVALLSDAMTAWPRAAVLPREYTLLRGNIRALGTVVALLSTLRKAPWLRSTKKLLWRWSVDIIQGG